MDQIVLDTSVIAKLFLEEEWSDIAIKIKDAHVQGKIEIAAPSLAKYELINALKYKNFGKEEIKDALEVIRDYAFLIVEPSDLVINKTADFSMDYGITAYDATYVAFANQLGKTLYTADNKMLLRVKKLNFIKHLTSFSL